MAGAGSAGQARPETGSQARTGHTLRMIHTDGPTHSGQAVAVQVPAGDGVVPLGVARDKPKGRVSVCWRPQRKRCSMKGPPTSQNKSSVRVTGREPEARGANDTPGHLPQNP